jgi:hypothetical protein
MSSLRCRDEPTGEWPVGFFFGHFFIEFTGRRRMGRRTPESGLKLERFRDYLRVLAQLQIPVRLRTREKMVSVFTPLGGTQKP